MAPTIFIHVKNKKSDKHLKGIYVGAAVQPDELKEFSDSTSERTRSFFITGPVTEPPPADAERAAGLNNISNHVPPPAHFTGPKPLACLRYPAGEMADAHHEHRLYPLRHARLAQDMGAASVEASLFGPPARAWPHCARKAVPANRNFLPCSRPR